MFEKMLTKSDFLTVLFYSKSDCRNCDRVLKELEKVSFLIYLFSEITLFV